MSTPKIPFPPSTHNRRFVVGIDPSSPYAPGELVIELTPDGLRGVGRVGVDGAFVPTDYKKAYTLEQLAEIGDAAKAMLASIAENDAFDKAPAAGYNSIGLTNAQVGVRDGWRLLTKEELTSRREDMYAAGRQVAGLDPRVSDLSIWSDAGWGERGCWGTDLGGVYRTRQPENFWLLATVPITAHVPRRRILGKADVLEGTDRVLLQSVSDAERLLQRGEGLPIASVRPDWIGKRLDGAMVYEGVKVTDLFFAVRVIEPSLQRPIDPGRGYRLLGDLERIKDTDEVALVWIADGEVVKPWCKTSVSDRGQLVCNVSRALRDSAGRYSLMRLCCYMYRRKVDATFIPRDDAPPAKTLVVEPVRHSVAKQPAADGSDRICHFKVGQHVVALAAFGGNDYKGEVVEVHKDPHPSAFAHCCGNHARYTLRILDPRSPVVYRTDVYDYMLGPA